MKRRNVTLVIAFCTLGCAYSPTPEPAAETNVATCQRVVRYIFACVDNTTPDAFEAALTACNDVLETSECNLSAYADCVTAVPCENFFGLVNTPCVDLAPSLECRSVGATGIDD